MNYSRPTTSTAYTISQNYGTRKSALRQNSASPRLVVLVGTTRRPLHSGPNTPRFAALPCSLRNAGPTLRATPSVATAVTAAARQVGGRDHMSKSHGRTCTTPPTIANVRRARRWPPACSAKAPSAARTCAPATPAEPGAEKAGCWGATSRRLTKPTRGSPRKQETAPGVGAPRTTRATTTARGRVARGRRHTRSAWVTTPSGWQVGRRPRWVVRAFEAPDRGQGRRTSPRCGRGVAAWARAPGQERTSTARECKNG